MKPVPDDASLLDILFDEDALYDEDKQLAARELPPPIWRAAQRAVDEILDFSRQQLELAWRRVHDQARRDWIAAAVDGATELRSGLEPLTRRGLLARLATLQERHGAALQVAYRRLELGDDDKLESLDSDELRALVRDLEELVAATLQGDVPEPLRLAHLIAGGVGTGQSRGRP